MAASPFSDELRVFQEKRDEWVRSNLGKFVVIQDSTVAEGFFNSYSEALQAGLPLVVTSVGAQGLPGLAAIVPVQDDADALAEAVLRLLSDDAAWQVQAAAQVAYAERHFSRETLRAALLAALAGEPPP